MCTGKVVESRIFSTAPVFGVIKPVRFVWASKKVPLGLFLLRSAASVSYWAMTCTKYTECQRK